VSKTRAGKVAAVLAAAGLALGGLLAIGVPSGAAQAAPMGCRSSFFYANTAQLRIWERTVSGTDVLAATSSVPINGLAQDPTTGHLYAFSSGAGLTSHLFRADADGSVTDLGVIAGVSDANGQVYSAAFDHTGKLWAEYRAPGNQLFPIDVANVTAGTPVPLSAGPSQDMAELNGTMYATRSTTLERIDLTTGTVTSVPLPGLIFPSGPSLWSMDGHLYVSTGGTRISEIQNPTSATPTLSPTVATLLTVVAGDGASCETAGNPFLNAVADDLTGTTVYSGVGGAAGNVFANDLLNGAAFQSADVTTSVLSDGGLTGVAVAADGALTVPAAAPAGTYAVGYQICQTATGRTAVCDTATATVRVTAVPVVDAVDDDFTATPITAGTAGTAGNVFADDTVNGSPVTPASVTATITADGGLTGAALTAAGDLTVPATAALGTYAVAYQLCAVTPSTACDTATATVRVVAATTPVTPPGAGTPGSSAPVGSGVTAVTPVAEDLASTGSDITTTAGATLGGVAAVIVGGALWLLARRRRASRL